MGEFCVRFHPHLFQDARPVSANSLITQRQEAGNFADRLPRGDQEKHLELAIRQGLVGQTFLASLQVNDQLLGDGWTDIPSAFDNFVDRLDQLLPPTVFGDVPCGSSFKSASRVLLLRVDAEDQYGKVRASLLHL